MKTIGLIGGLSWQSSAEYYRIINEEINSRFGLNHSGKILMYSFDFQEIEDLQIRADWEGLDQRIALAGNKLKNGNAECIMICSNTMHICMNGLSELGTPIIHIVESTGHALNKIGIKKAGLLGTKYLMTSDLYPKKLHNGFDIETIIPSNSEMEMINGIIYNELVKGLIIEESRSAFISIIDNLIARGAEAIILGCTEIPLLIKQKDINIPVIDTTYQHAVAGVEFSLKK